MSEISKTIDKYLTEGSKKDDLEKVKKVVMSAKTDEQMVVAIKMFKNWSKLHHKEGFFFSKYRENQKLLNITQNLIAKKIHDEDFDINWLNDFNKKLQDTMEKMGDK